MQHYLFLDQNVLSTNATGTTQTTFEYYADGNAVNPTRFPYEFPTGEDVNITGIHLNDLQRSGDIDDYIDLHNTVIIYNRTATQDNYRSTRQIGEFGSAFVSADSNFSSSTILLHGQWSSLTADFRPQPNNWSMIYTGTDGAFPFPNYVLQNTPLNSYMDVEILKGEYSGGAEIPTTQTITRASDLEYLVDTNLDSLERNNLLLSQTINGTEKYFIPIAIKRKLNSFGTNALSDSKFGYYSTSDNSLYVFGESTAAVGSVTVNSITNSYTKYKTFVSTSGAVLSDYAMKIDSGSLPTSAADFNNNPTTYGVAFNTGAAYYWPFILTVEYETCSTPSPTGGTWELHYDGNYKDPKNIPAPVTNIRNGEEVKLAAGPKRDGYTFKKWCTDKEGKASCFDAETNFENTTGSSKVTLYAQWGDTNGADNKDTGVFSYVISFIAVGTIAGTIYYVSKKKNLFKQI